MAADAQDPAHTAHGLSTPAVNMDGIKSAAIVSKVSLGEEARREVGQEFSKRQEGIQEVFASLPSGRLSKLPTDQRGLFSLHCS